MNIVLMGYMGSGKSLIGQMLAERLSVNFADLDDIIEQNEARSIREIFGEKGEIYFRTVEAKTLRSYIQTTQNGVLALGGGTPCYAGNMDLLNASTNCTTVYLKASIPTLAQRLMAERDKRPLLQHLQTLPDLQEFIGKHLFERNNFYTLAKLQMSTDGKLPETIVDEIIKALT